MASPYLRESNLRSLTSLTPEEDAERIYAEELADQGGIGTSLDAEIARAPSAAAREILMAERAARGGNYQSARETYQPEPVAPRRVSSSSNWRDAVGDAKYDGPSFDELMASLDTKKPVSEKKNTFADYAKDTALDAASGIVGFGESAVGVANLATFGVAGKLLEAIGYDPKQTKEFLAGMQSVDRKRIEQEIGAKDLENEKISEAAQGFTATASAEFDAYLDKAKMLGANPSALMGRIVQSLPSVFGAGAAARMFLPKAIAGAKAAGLSGAEAEAFIAKKVIGYASAAEGAMAAGSIAEQGRQSGREWSDFAAPAAAGGAITAAVGRGSGAIGRKLGIGDIESDIAGGAVRSGGTGTWRDKFVPRVLLEGTKEGLFEETPQSLNEAIMGNLATGEPWGKGVGAQTAEGTLAGLGMGAGHAALFSAPKPTDILNAPTIDSAIDTATKALDSASLDPVIAAYDDLIGQQRQVRDANQQALLGDEEFNPGAVQPASGFANRFPPEPPRALTYHPTAGQLVVFPDGSAMTRAEYEQRKAQQEQSRLDGMVQDAPLPGMMQRAVEQSAPVADAMELNALVRDERADKNARLKAEMERLKASRQATPAALPSESSAPAPVIQPQQAVQPSVPPATSSRTAMAQQANDAMPTVQRSKGHIGFIPATPESPVVQELVARNDGRIGITDTGKAIDSATGNRFSRSLVHDTPENRQRLMQELGVVTVKPQKNSQTPTERQKPAVAFAIGQTPTNAEPITVRNGVVYQGEYALEDYETGKPITVPEGATHAQIRKAMEDAGQVPKGFKFFGEAKSADAVAVAPTQAAPAVEDPQTHAIRSLPLGRKKSPIMKRDDLVGAIMRVTGGDGIAANLAQTITGDTANNVTKLRGLFANNGNGDLDDVAMLLRMQEGYDIRDGNHLSDLISEAAAGNMTYSMERTERERASAADAEHREHINARASELGLKKIGGRRNLKMVEADIAREEKRLSDLEAQAEREAIVASEAIDDAIGLDMTEPDWMKWVSDDISGTYTQEDIDRAEENRANRENARAKALAYDYAEGQAQGNSRQGNGDSQAAAEGGGTETGARGFDAFQKRIEYLTDRSARFGRSAVEKEARESLLSASLARDFGESMDDYYARNPGHKAKDDATKAWLGGSALSGNNAGNEESLTLRGQTNAEAAAEFRRQQEEANRQDKEPPAKNVTVDQVDLFNTQSGLFNSNREAPKASQPRESESRATLPVSKAAVREITSPESAEVAKLLGKALPKGGKVGVIADISTLPSAVEATGTRMSRKTAEAIRFIAQMFGRKVVFYEATHNVPEGINQDGKTLYVNVDSGVDALAVAGHEFTHSLQHTDPEAYQAALDAVKGILEADPKRAKSYAAYYGKQDMDADALAAELLSDIGGNLWRDESFFGEMFAEVQRQHPHAEARSIITRLRDALVSFINKLIAATPKQGFQLEEKGLITREELESIKALIVKMAADAFIAEEKARVSGEVAYRGEVRGDVKFSQARLEKALGPVRNLVTLHNLSEDNLLHAKKMGGIAVPSLAVTKKNAPITGFGEITLIAPKAMIDPKGYAGTKVYGADIYSPRYPQVSYKLSSSAMGRLNEMLAGYRNEGERPIYGGDIDRADDLTSNAAFKRYADEKVGDTASWSQLKSLASEMLSDAGAEERIFQGYSNSGNRRYTPHTLESVVKILKKELRGGEGFNYGTGSVRAKFTPQFKSISQIQKAKDRLVSKADFEKIKSEIDDELMSVAEALQPFHPASNRFGFLDTVTMAMGDSAKMGVSRALEENGFEDVSSEARQEFVEFVNKLRNLPTEYFEAKILRDVDVAEFVGAVVPEGTSQKAIDYLKERGINDIAEYKYGDDSDRAAKVEELATKIHEEKKEVLFSPARQSREWQEIGSNANGPVYVGNGFTVHAVRQFKTDTDFEEADGLPWGHATYVEDKAYRFNILDAQGKSIGFVDAEVNELDEITAIHDIAISNPGKGVGTKIVAQMLANSYDGVRIIEALPQSKEFWERFGASYDYRDNAKIHWEDYERLSGQGGEAQTGTRRMSPARGETEAGEDAKARREEVTQDATRQGGVSLSGNEVDFDATGQFWNDIEAGKTAWSRKEIEDVYAQGRRGTRRTAKNIEGVAGGSTTPDDVARATVVWDESIAGFNGYATSGRRFGKHFVVSVVPELFHKSTDYDSKASVDNSSVVQYVFTPMEDGRYELSVMDPLTGGRAYNNLRLKGRLNETGGRVSVVLDNPYRESRAFLQEAVRRLALSDGAVPVVVEAGREGGARAGSTEEREFSQERIKARFSQPREQDATRQGGVSLSTVRAQTETPEFKRWFGDSKVVDAEGKPLVVYHGTQSDVEAFDSEKTKSEGGAFYFIKDAYITKGAAGARAANTYAKGHGSNVMPVYLSMKTPLIAGFTEPMPEGVSDEDFSKWMDRLETFNRGIDFSKNEYFEEVIAQAKRDGHDGVIIRGVEDDRFDGPNVMPSDVYIAFRPEQIKSATGNRGTFDGSNPDIRYSTPRVQQGEAGKPFTLEVTPQDGQRFRDGVTAADEDDAIRFANFLWPNADVRVLAQKAFVPDLRYSLPRQTQWYYSQLSRAVESAPEKVFGPAKQVSLWLQSNKAKLGIKDDELQWTGVLDWLETQQRVTKAEVLAYLDANGVQVQEVVKGAAIDAIQILRDLRDQGDYYLGEGITLLDMGEAFEAQRDGNYIGSGDMTEAGVRKFVEDARSDGANLTADTTKYGSYVLPGGENYRELLLTLPEKHTYPQAEPLTSAEQDRAAALTQKMRRDGNLPSAEMAEWRSLKEKSQAHLDELDALKSAGKNQEPFRSNHWDEDNILAHIRYNDRTDADGNKVLFIEELQSDWGQKGREDGFAKEKLPSKPSSYQDIVVGDRIAGWGKVQSIRQNHGTLEFDVGGLWLGENRFGIDNVESRDSSMHGDAVNQKGVPSAPFVTDTKSWVALAVKRMIAHAAQNGYDKVAFVTGEQSAERYDLSKQLDSVEYRRNPEGGGEIVADDKTGRRVLVQKIDNDDQLEDYIGKDAAKKMMQQEPMENYRSEVKSYVLNDADLKVGGEGMKTFYDRIVPQVVNDVLKKVGGGKVETVELDQREPGSQEWFEELTDADILKQPGFTITPAMKEKVAGGLPLFSTQRAVDELNAQIKEQEGVDNAFSVSDLGDKNLISVFKRVFDVEVVPVTPNTAQSSFFAAMNYGGRLYVNAQHEKAGFVQLAGHELLHQIANDMPETYRWFEAIARDHMSADSIGSYSQRPELQGYDKTGEDTYQEMVADFVGDSLADKAFLQALADNNPSMFKDFVRYVIRWLNDVSGKLTREGLGSYQYFNDVRDLQGYLLSVIDAYAKTKEVPRFSTQRIVGASNRQYTQAQQQAFANTGRTVDEKTTLEKLKAFVAKRWQQGIFDQFAPFRQIDMDAYTLMRLSKGSTGAFEALMHHGKLAIKDGAYDADTSGGVMDRLFYQLGKESTDFLYWVAGNRAERLAKEGKENLFSPQDIAAYKSLASGTADFDYTIQTGPGAGKVTRDRTLIYADAQRVMNEFNKNVLDMAEESGLIDGDSRELWEHEFYVPFYRVMEDDEGSVRGANISKGLVRQEAFKKLKGGTEGLNDLLANTLMNWAHLIDASAKNRAASAAIKAAENVGVARPAVHGEKNTVWYMGMVERKIPAGTEYEENGVVKIAGKDTKIRSIGKVEYKVEDAAVMEAITGLEYAGIRGPIMDILAKPKHWLTIGVTASPFFKVRNLIRDSLQAIGTSDLSKNPIANVVEGMKLTNRQRQEYVSALAGGGLIRFGTMLENNEAARTRQLIKKGAKDGHILDGEPAWRKAYDKWFEPAVAAYNELGNRGEEINRMALYDQLRKKGVNHATASLMARDLMDFSLQGSFQTIRFLSQVVPFFNARLQGMYKLGRATKENREQMAFVIFASALAGLGLMALAAGDEDKWKKWKRREEWDKASYWWFEFGGMEFRIPKPFELGAVAHIAERTVEAMFDNERDVGKRWAQAMLDLGKNQLAMNPVPQAFKPIIDLYANKDSFTGRPIETMAMQRLAPTERYTAATTMPARGLSSAIGGALSPVQIDQLVRSYFGWFGATVVGAADMLTRAVNDEPTRPALDYFKFASGGMVKEDETSSRYVTQMYEQAAELEQAYATYNRMRKEGRLDEAKEYAEDNADKLKAYRSVEAVKKQEKQINERIRMIERSELHPAEKRIKIRELKRKQSEIAERLSRQ